MMLGRELDWVMVVVALGAFLFRKAAVAHLERAECVE